MPDHLWGNMSGSALEECAGLLREQLGKCVEEVKRIGTRQTLAKGAVIASTRPYWLESGKCALCVDDPRGDDRSLFYFRPRQFVNFLPLLVKCFPIDPHMRRGKVPSCLFRIRALTECELIAVDEKLFMDALLNSEGMSLLVLFSCSLNLINSFINAYNSPILSNPQRICRFVLGHMDTNSGNAIAPYLTHAEISRHLSMHTITVSKIFSKMRAEGIIDKVGNQIVITDMAALRAIADGTVSLTY